MGQVLNLSGQRYGRLTVVRFVGIKWHKAIWECRCECGEVRQVCSIDLRSGNSQSCGCLKLEVLEKRCLTHGMSKSSEFRVWTDMLTRCNNPNSPTWENYGARGIRVCERWANSFEAFFQDMGRKPARGWSIERMDNEGEYGPENCRWATAAEQLRNTRHNVRLTYGGETMCQQDWAKRLGIHPHTIARNLKNGRSFDWVVEHLKARQAA